MNAQKIFTALAVILFSTMVFAAANPVIQGIPDTTIIKDSQELEKFVDLRDYAYDNETSEYDMFYKITSQTNVSLIDCYIKDDYFVSCRAPTGNALGTNKITISATNEQGVSDYDEFNVNVIDGQQKEEITLTADRDEVVIEPGDSINVQFTAENTTDKKVCMDITANLDKDERDEIKAVPSQKEFCLNADEKTRFTVTITSFEGARTGIYDIEVELDYGFGTRKQIIVTEVTDIEDPIDITRKSDYYVCREPYKQDIVIRLENNSNTEETISLRAGNDILLPVFEFSETTLRPGYADEMNLTIRTNETTKLTEYTIPVFARSSRFYVERDIKIRLVECEKNYFDLQVSPSQRYIEKGGKEYYTVTLTSESNEDQYVNLVSESELPTDLEETRIFLEAWAVEKLDLEVSARKTDKDGAYKIKVTAWNAFETEEETVKAIVEAERQLEVIVENNDFEARICSASMGQIYEVRIINKGDYDEEIELYLRNVPKSVQALLSDEEITIGEDEEKTIYVFVNPTWGTPIGDYRIKLVVNSKGEDFEKELRFRVLEAEEGVRGNVIELSAFLREVAITPGEERTLSFTITNPLPVAMENMSLRFFGTGNDIAIFPVSIGRLEAGKSITIKRVISANPNAKIGKEYNATIEARADGYLTTGNMKIKVENSPGSQQTTDNGEDDEGFLAGLAVLLKTEFLVGGVIILILLIAIILMLSLLHSNESKEVVYYQRDGGI